MRLTRIQKTVLGVVCVGAAAYVAALGYLKVNETRLVYAGMTRTDASRFVPADSTLPWDSVRVRAADSTPVFLVVSRLDESSRKPWALYLHGNDTFVGSRSNIERYRILRAAGYSVVAVEYRGFGASAANGPPTEAGLHADALAAWLYMTRKLRVPHSQIIIYGWSLGSGPAVKLAIDVKPAALITDGAFTSLPDAARERYPWVPTSLLMKNRLDNLSLAGKVTTRWVILHGRSDEEVSFSQGLKLAEAAPKDRLIPLDGDHRTAVTANRDYIAQELRPLVTMPKYWSPNWVMADSETVRLSPDAFPQLPEVVRADLKRRGCTVPQAAMVPTPHNVISGSFIEPGQKDWAVLCSIWLRSRIIVYPRGEAIDADVFSAVPDFGFLQGMGGDSVGYSRVITAVDRDYIMGHWKEYGGPVPPPIVHDGIDDAFAEKGSAIAYFFRGKWLTLQGAN